MKTISAEELCDLIKNSDKHENVFIDVRTPEEYLEKRIPGVINIPLNELETRLEELKPYKNIYVHCKKGGRGGQACEVLGGLGFENVYNLEGGLDAWESCHLETNL